MSDLMEMNRVLDIEAQSILDLKTKNEFSFPLAVELLLSCTSKVVLTGIGKSGVIARKIASTLSSTGTPAIFIHPAESSHGDLGMIASQDVTIALSYGGESEELIPLLNYCSRKNIPVIAFTGKTSSTLAQAARIVLDVGVNQEACPLGLAPTSSTTASLALGDALAMALLKRKGFKEEDFGEFHPGGILGRKLLTRVKDLMHKEDSLPLVSPQTLLRDVISVMTSKDVRGVAGVVSDGALFGIITDGDIRRRLKSTLNPLEDTAGDLLARNPKTIDQNELAEKALFMMELFSIQTLFVLDQQSTTPKKPIGLIHLQDLLKAKIR